MAVAGVGRDPVTAHVVLLTRSGSTGGDRTGRLGGAGCCCSSLLVGRPVGRDRRWPSHGVEHSMRLSALVARLVRDTSAQIRVHALSRPAGLRAGSRLC